MQVAPMGRAGGRAGVHAAFCHWRAAFALAAAFCMLTMAAGCAAQRTPTLTVYAASSLTEAFTAIGREFEARNGEVRVEFNFAGSQALRTQIEHGAAADLFASADVLHVEKLQEQQLVADEPMIFARNFVVVALPAANPAGLTRLQDLAQPGVRLVVAQEHVPVGRYTRQVLANLSAEDAFGAEFGVAVLANVKSEELNVRQVVAKVVLGEVDAGFVYLSDVAALTGEVATLEIPARANVRAAYPIVLLGSAREAALARRFVAFLRSPIAQDILRQAGLQPVAAQ